jgi:hypothetical protein
MAKKKAPFPFPFKKKGEEDEEMPMRGKMPMSKKDMPKGKKGDKKMPCKK